MKAITDRKQNGREYKNMKAKSIPVSYHVSNPEGIEIIGREADEVGASFTTNGTITTAELPEAADWSDAQLINLVRCDPPDEGALDILIARYWNAVFGRCQMLTQNYDKALDLAQATWYRLLRSCTCSCRTHVPLPLLCWNFPALLRSPSPEKSTRDRRTTASPPYRRSSACCSPCNKQSRAVR